LRLPDGATRRETPPVAAAGCDVVHLALEISATAALALQEPELVTDRGAVAGGRGDFDTGALGLDRLAGVL
jgi:hypothetical protein